jgi:hypothetical protein
MRILATAVRRRGAVRWCAVACCVVGVGLSAASTAFATPPPASTATHTTRLQINPRQAWTQTGVVLHRGDVAQITATGTTHFGLGPIAALPPEGIPQGPKCAAARAVQGKRVKAQPAPTLSCWSLIGQIGSGDPFEIGRAHTVRAGSDGALSVGVNDDLLHDNSGGWFVTIRVSPAPPSKPATTPPGSASRTSKKSSNFFLLAAVAAGVIVALLLLAVFLRRRRSRHAGQAAPAQARAPAPAPTTVTQTALAGSAAATNAVVPPEGESTAGNILEVTLVTRRSLLVGYNHFPEATIVHWRITQNATVMTGEFETDGRTAARQDVTLPLESELDAAIPADIAFAWSVGGVAFNYAVRRNPESEPQT